MINKKYKTLITKIQLNKRIKELGKQITKEYEGKELIILALADGGLMFAMDLIRQIKLPLKYYTCIIKSYGNNTVSNGQPKIHFFPQIDLDNKDIIIIDDICDSGQTLIKIKDYIYHVNNNCNSIEFCTLFKNKRNSLKNNDLIPKYIGFESNGEWLVGYGLDDQEYNRNINCIKYVEKEK